MLRQLLALVEQLVLALGIAVYFLAGSRTRERELLHSVSTCWISFTRMSKKLSAIIVLSDSLLKGIPSASVPRRPLMLRFNAFALIPARMDNAEAPLEDMSVAEFRLRTTYQSASFPCLSIASTKSCGHLSTRNSTTLLRL